MKKGLELCRHSPSAHWLESIGKKRRSSSRIVPTDISCQLQGAQYRANAAPRTEARIRPIPLSRFVNTM